MRLRRWTALILILAMIALVPALALAVDNNDTRIGGTCPGQGASRNNGHHLYFAEVSQPTCTRDGACTWVCLYCKDAYTEILPALGHSWDSGSRITKAPTCSEPGTETRVCTRCRQQETVTLPALGHAWAERLISQTDAGCESEGTKTYENYCTRCGVIGSTRTETVPAKGHSWGGWVIDEKATCTVKGFRYRTCERCGTQDWREIKPLGHDWDEGKITREATPTEPGEITYTCKNDPSHTKTEEFPFGADLPVLPAAYGAVDLILTVTQTSPAKAAYDPAEVLTFDLTLTNNGSLDMPEPGFSYSFYANDKTEVIWVKSDELGKAVLAAGESVAFSIAIDISDTAVNNKKQILDVTGFAQLPEEAKLTAEQKEFHLGDQLFTKACKFTFPVNTGEKDEALHLTLNLLTAPQPIYYLSDYYAWEVVLTNTGTSPLTDLTFEEDWKEYTGPVSSFTGPSTLDPSESWSFVYSDTISVKDVENGTLTLAYTGFADGGVTSNTEQLAFTVGQLPPPPGNAALHLDVTRSPELTEYEVDGMGDTVPIAYTVSVTNTGDMDVDLNTFSIEINGTEQTINIATQLLKPHDTFSCCLLSTCLNEADITPGTKTAAKLGTVTVTFTALGDYPGTYEHCCMSNPVELDHDLVEPGPWTPEETSFDVEKIVTNMPVLNPNGYMRHEIIEYDIIITNTGDITVSSVDVHDILYDSGSDDILVTETNIAPMETRTVHFSYEVTDSDVDSGYGYIKNEAYVTWTDAYTGEMSSWSNPVYSPLTDEPMPAYLEVVKNVKGSPDNGLYYVIGEEVEFEIVVTNVSDVQLTNVKVWDLNALEYPMGLMATYPTLDPHESKTLTFKFTLTDIEADDGFLKNTAWADGFVQKDFYILAISNEVTVPVHRDAPKDIDIFLKKEEASTPANHKYYVLDEEIVYTITVENIGETILYDIALYDTLDDFSMGDFAHVGVLNPSEKQTFEYKHVVTQEDVDAGQVVNYVIADYWPEGKSIYYTVYDGPVISPTRGTEPTPGTPEIVKDDSCRLTLTAYGIASETDLQHFCAAHLKVKDKADTIVGKAFTKDEKDFAWQQAAAVWRAALEEEYAAVYKAASGKAKVAIAEEKTIFFLYLDSYEALLRRIWPGDTASAYEALTELIRAQCCELCYLRHNPSAKRPDSVITGRYAISLEPAGTLCGHTVTPARGGNLRIDIILCEDHSAMEASVNSLVGAAGTRAAIEEAFRRGRRVWQSALDRTTTTVYRAADPEARQFIASYRTLFDQFVDKHAGMLEEFYPNNPEIVAEIICRMVRHQALLVCETW